MYNETKIKNEKYEESGKDNGDGDETDNILKESINKKNINNITFHINDNESYTIDIINENENKNSIIKDNKININTNSSNIENINHSNFSEGKIDFPKGKINLIFDTTDLDKKNIDNDENINMKNIIRNIKREISLINYKKYYPKTEEYSRTNSSSINNNDEYIDKDTYINNTLNSNSNEDVIRKVIDNIDEDRYEEDNGDEKDKNIELWTDNIEEQIENFAELCEKESIELNKKGNYNLYIGRSMQILLIILGSISIYSSSTTMLDSSIKDIIVLLSGFTTTVISSIYTMFGFTKKSTIIYEISLGLDNISRMIRCELLKPRNIRKSPYDLIYICNITRDKLIKKREYN